ncbi:MAG: hypothetical protein AVDCRST_MAG83-1533, partial [uncultured Arthrobacter sp.]
GRQMFRHPVVDPPAPQGHDCRGRREYARYV